MNDYKYSLNLPQTDFPMRANLKDRELQILKRWQDLDLYANLRTLRKNQPQFILLDGPPYANGNIHLGHAVNKILKDIIIKAKTLSGFDAPFIPGWDCHGLPIELNVEKKYGKAGIKISAAEFRVKCREYAASQIDCQRSEFKRLGVLGDWENPYVTMDYQYEANIIRSLAKILHNRHILRGYKPVSWCLACTSALAEAEIEYEDKVSPAIDVGFGVHSPLDLWRRFACPEPQSQARALVPIWTTTPWTLPGNAAVAVNPSIHYALIAAHWPDKIQYLVLAVDLIAVVCTRYGIVRYDNLGVVSGDQLLGLQLTHPFYAKIVEIVAGEHVTVAAGTGLVHIAPAHGVEDYAIGKKYQLELNSVLDDHGHYIPELPLLAGLSIHQANDAVCKLIAAQDLLLHDTKITHSYPHCWRHKTPLILRATQQWFINMDSEDLRQSALALVKEITWSPEWGAERMYGLMADRPDWCLSRQRAWGVPLPFFVHKITGELHPQTIAYMEKIALQVEEYGAEVWYTLDSASLLGKHASDYQKVTDILDVWFDSGVAHECVLKMRPELRYPADMILEGSDQHRGWFGATLLSAVAMNKTTAYAKAITHGFVVDGQGRKMSKSLGNVIAPQQIMNTQGADILRLWVASIDYRHEINASAEIFTRIGETYRRIRNTIRFLLANLYGFNPAEHMQSPRQMLVLDQVVVDTARILQAEICAAYEEDNFHLVVQKIHHFCINDLGGFYLDIIKDRQYTLATNSNPRRSAQTALFHIAHAMVRWLAPILSFTAEEFWSYLPGRPTESVLLTTWYQDLAPLSNAGILSQAYWQKLRSVRDMVNKHIEEERAIGRLGSGLEAKVEVQANTEWLALLRPLANELKFIFIVSEVSLQPLDAQNAVDNRPAIISGLRIIIHALTQPKCVRCWHRVPDVDINADYPGICGRCIVNIAGTGETRLYA